MMNFDTGGMEKTIGKNNRKGLRGKEHKQVNFFVHFQRPEMTMK